MTLDPNTAALVRLAETSGHSLFAPSAAHRWMTCPASLLAALRVKADLIDEDGTPVTGSNVYSVEGTAAHEVAQLWLERGFAPDEKVGSDFIRDGISVTITEEMVAFVGQYVDWVAMLGDGRQGVEVKVDLSFLFPVVNQGGTADHIHFDSKTGTLTITDLKYGQGVRVFAHRNYQLMLYAIGALHWLLRKDPHADIRKIVLRIAQPRLEHFDTYELDLIELQHFAHEVRQRAALALSPDAPYGPDPKACRFCPAKSNCRALKGSLETLAKARFVDAQPDEDFDASSEAIAATLTTEEMAHALRWRKTMESWFSALEAELFKRADAGLDVPGFKIAEGRRSRKWRDATKAADALEVMGLDPSDIFTQEMISPAAAERVLSARRLAPKKVLGSLLEITSGPRTLAPLVDPRSALAGSSAKFGPVTDGELDDLS